MATYLAGDVEGKKERLSGIENGGGDGDRTHDPFHAMEVLSQLSYAPISEKNLGPKPRGVILMKTPKKTRSIAQGRNEWWAKQDSNL